MRWHCICIPPLSLPATILAPFKCRLLDFSFSLFPLCNGRTPETRCIIVSMFMQQKLDVSRTGNLKLSVICDLIFNLSNFQITYIGRQGLGSSQSVRIPLGAFFGHRFLTQHHLALFLPPSAPLPPRHPVPLRHLCQLLEDVACRHQLAADALTSLVDGGGTETAVREAYKAAAAHKLHWNLIHRLLLRLQPILPSTHASLASLGSSQLRVTAELAAGLLLRAGPHAQLLVALPPDGGRPDPLTIDLALDHFRHFCLGATASPRSVRKRRNIGSLVADELS